MSNIKCPFCGRELSEYDHFDRLLVCFNPQCEAVFTKKDFLGNKNLWQELIRTRKALEIAINAIKSAKDYNAVNCVARGKELSTDDVHITLFKALEQITALEQKDK